MYDSVFNIKQKKNLYKLRIRRPTPSALPKHLQINKMIIISFCVFWNTLHRQILSLSSLPEFIPVQKVTFSRIGQVYHRHFQSPIYDV